MTGSNLEIRRGEIWIGNLNDTKKEKTSKQVGIRPLIIIQNNIGNKYSPTVIVAVITGQTGKKPLPTHVEIGTDSGLNRPSSILLEQIFTIDKTDLINRLGKANNKIMEEVDRAIMTSGGIEIEKFVNEKQLFNLTKAKNIVEAIKEVDEFIIEYKPKKVEGLLKSRQMQIIQLKDYCKSYGVDYIKLYNEYLVYKDIQNAIYDNEGVGKFVITV